MTPELFKEKSTFIDMLAEALDYDERSNVEDIAYRYDPKFEDEYITIFFRGGGKKQILATGNSNGANAKEIIKAIYG